MLDLQWHLRLTNNFARINVMSYSNRGGEHELPNDAERDLLIAKSQFKHF